MKTLRCCAINDQMAAAKTVTIMWLSIVMRCALMAGKARMRFIARSNRLRFDRDSGHFAGENLYGVECIYCHDYFPNVKKPEFGGHVCRSCK